MSSAQATKTVAKAGGKLIKEGFSKGGVIGGCVAIAGVVVTGSIAYCFDQYDKRKESEKRECRTNYNYYNDQLNQSQKQLATYRTELSKVNISLHEQTQQLQNLNNKFIKEIKGLPLFMAIGLTGQGKSTFCNRLLGDTSKKGNQGPFKTGRGQCVTTKVSKKTFTYTRLGHNITASIIDSPGFDDTKKRDDIFMDNIISCIKQCGGITKFLLVIDLSDKRPARGSFVDLLTNYEKRFTKKFWKYTIVVFTNVDDFDEDEEEEKENQINTVYGVLKKDFGQQPDYIFSGHTGKQYNIAIDTIMNGNLKNKFKDQTLKSPLDDLIIRQTELNKNIRTMTQEVNNNRTNRDEWKSRLDNF